MKLLYLSCHSVLEYDEVKLFTELGIDVFSHGAYTNPLKPGDPKRPSIEAKFHQDLYNLSITHSKDDLHKDMIEWADVIICMHIVDWLTKNWGKLRHKRVIYRSIGQSTLNVEEMLKPLRRDGLEVVRYSPREKTIPGFVGEDAMIRFYKDPDEFKDWTGQEKRVLTIGQSMKSRKDFCGYEVFEKVTRGVPRLLVGPGNEGTKDISTALFDYSALKRVLQNFRAYFYTGTFPASYTLNFIEALMTGIPIVALGPELGSSPFERGQDTYEIPDIIKNGENGFFSDDLEELRKYIDVLFNDYALAQKIGEAGRRTAIKFFAKEKIKKEWKEFLDV
ncbi:MAG TPA: hypothetical protein VMY36_00085 [Patescibacteria group bacterium]|nr:hypothetical protein [Patescibacteria group bacterium]